MAECTEEFLENILSRLGNGPFFTDDELLKTIDNIDKRLKDVDNKIETDKAELKDSLGKLNAGLNVDFCHSDSSAFHCFLNNVLQAIERNVGVEDFILNDLISFCHNNNIIIPLHDPGVDVHQSHSSLNYCTDESEEKTLQLWVKIKAKLKTGLTNLLKSPSSSANFQLPLCTRRIQLIKLMNYLYSCDEVLEIYFQLRSWELDSKGTKFRALSVSFEDEDDSRQVRLIEALDKIVERRITMLDEDIKLFQNVFTSQNKSTPFKALLDLYSDKIQRYLKTFIDCFIEDSSLADNKSENTTSIREEHLKFSAKDLQNFAKVFYLLDKWSETVQNALRSLSVPDDKTKVKQSSNSTKLSLIISDHESHMRLADIWNWKETIETAIPLLLKVVPPYVTCLFTVIFNNSNFKPKNEDNDVNVCVLDHLIRYQEEYPLQVSQTFGTFISLINEVLIFSKYDDFGIFNEIREETLTALHDPLNSCVAHFSEILKEFKTNPSNIDAIYQQICSISFMQSQLVTWEDISSGRTRRNEFYLVSKQLEKVRNECVTEVIRYHLNVVKSSLVYDANSNNWEEERVFFEGERCSFPIQMWNFYIRGVIHDIFTQLPCTTAKYVVAELCKEMLMFFAFRYTHVIVSYRRVQQLRADILTLLGLFRWLMFFIADSAKDFLNLENKRSKLWHSLCTTLLETVVITTAPLSMVTSCLEISEMPETDSDCPRLTWFNDMYVTAMRSDELMVLFEMVVKQPITNWNLLVQLMITDNAELPILITKNHEALKELVFEDISMELNLNELFSSKQEKTSQDLVVTKLQEAIYFVLLHSSTSAYVHYMASVIKTDNSKSFKVNNTEQLPVWLRLVAKELNPYFTRIFTPVLELLFYEEKCKATPSFNFMKLNTLPCGCPTTFETDKKRFKTIPELLHKCLMDTLTFLTQNIALIPGGLWNTLAYVKSHEIFTASWIQQPCLGTKILACLVYHWLLTKENLQNSTYGSKLTGEFYENVENFAELVWHVIFHLTHDVTENPKISMEVFKLLRATADEVKLLLTELDTHCNLEKYESCENVALEDREGHQSPVFLSETETGVESLKYLSSVLKLNQVAIRKLLDSGDTDDGKELVSDPICLSNKNFDPYTEYKQLGDFPFDHSELLQRELDWPHLIPVISKAKWKILILNRFEFQESEDILTPEEKDKVTQIKELLDIK